MNCRNHPDKFSVGKCTACGGPFCDACLTEIDGKVYCRDCEGKAREKAMAKATAEPPSSAAPGSEARPPESPAKKGLSGVVVGLLIAGGLLIFCCIAGILVAILMPAFMGARKKANLAKCMNNLRQIGMASMMYADEYGRFPHVTGDPDGAEALRLLVRKKYVEGENIYRCPGSDKGGEMYGGYSYEGFLEPYPATVSPHTMILWDKEPVHRQSGQPARNVLFGDGRVETLVEEKFQQLFMEQESRAKQGR
jgi:prepilin-type processing-associated H-X9-DG protein